MTEFVNVLDAMFPSCYQEENIGYKLDSIDKNIFLNEFLYGVLNEITGQVDQDIMRDHFAMNHSEEREIYVSPLYKNKNTIEGKINLNNIFNETVDKEIFFN